MLSSLNMRITGFRVWLLQVRSILRLVAECPDPKRLAVQLPEESTYSKSIKVADLKSR